MSRREVALTLARVAGYHGDMKEFVRVYVEYRVAMPAMQEAYNAGFRAKINGIPCTCHVCKAEGVIKNAQAKLDARI